MNPEHLLWHLLLALAAVVATGQVLGRLFRLVGQPPVIGEVVAGIALGPSLLGHFWPAGYAYLLPPELTPHLGLIAQLGIVLYMFAIGLELDTGRLRQQGLALAAISQASILVPFVLGVALSWTIYKQFARPGVAWLTFALFLGVAMSITAFPVLARILSDRGLTRTTLGTMALTAAAINDVTAWCLLALAAGVARAQVVGALPVLLWTPLYLLAMFFVARPLVGRWLASHSGRLAPRVARPEIDVDSLRKGPTPPVNVDPTSGDSRSESPTLNGAIGPGQIAVAFVALLLSALTTEWIGIHAIFGAFVLGAVIPHDSPLAEQLGKHIENVVGVLLLPAFFALTGMRTEIGLVTTAGDWLLCGAIIAVATLGKFGGTLAAARLSGQSWQAAAGLGVLMNTRGLMELIVLNVGLDLGIITPRLFTMMVIMALVTTIATTPLLQWIGTECGDSPATPLNRKPASEPISADHREASAP